MAEQDNTNPTVTTPQVDTSSWGVPSMSPTHVDVQQPNLSTPTPAMPRIDDRTAEVNSFIGSMRYDASTSIGKSKEGSWIKDIDPTGGKLQTTSQVSLKDTHQLLNDGTTWLPKYESFLPGVDNDSRLSAQQTDWEKFSNPIKRFGSNASKGILDIGSFVYGVGAAAMSGRFDALYDNAMSKYVDDLTTRTNFEYKNYYDEETRKKGLGLDLQTWDKVLGGAEFTARMLASESVIALATWGNSLPSSFARAGLKAGMALDKAADLTKITQTGQKISKMMSVATLPERTLASTPNVAKMSERFQAAMGMAANRGKVADKLVQARFATTSPMYEAGFEAMHFRKEAEQQFHDYYRNKGIEPTPEEINKFSEKMSGASNIVFAANMGILSVSNLALFGDLLNVKNPLAKSVFSPSDFFKKNVYKMGTEKVASTGVNQAIKATAWNKAAAYLSPVVKGMAIEGVYEEGSQGVASGTLKNYVASAYDEEAMKSTVGYVDAFGRAFNEQFGSKQGQEEIIIGAIIGGLFGGVGGIKNAAREYKQQESIANLQNVGEEFIENFRSNAYTNEQLLSLFSGANRFQNLRDIAEKSEAQGDKMGEASAKAQSFISLLDSYHSVGKESQFTEMFESMLKGLDNQSIADSTGLDLSEVDAFKQEQIQGMNEMAKNYATAREAGRYIFRPNIGGFAEQEINGKKVRVNSENLSSAFAFASTMSFFNEKFAIESFDAFQTKLAQMNASPQIVEKMGAIAVLKNLAQTERKKYTLLAQEENKLRLDLGKITRQVNTLTNSEEKTGKAQKLLELSDRMTEVQTKLSEVSSKKDMLWKSSVDNFYSKMGKTGYATQLDLENFSKEVQDIQDILDGLNPKTEDKIQLEKLLEQFNQANTSYKSFADLASKLSDPQFSFKTYRGILSGTRARADKSLNEHTRESLLKVYGYNQELSEEIERTYLENQKTAIEESKLESGYTPTQEDLTQIKNKIDSGRTLSPNEKKFYENNRQVIDEFKTKDQINPLSSESNDTEITNLSIKKNSLRQSLSRHRDGEYSPELQNRLDSINREIEQLQEEIMGLTANDIDPTQDSKVQKLDQEILELEQEILELESSRPVFEARKKREVSASKVEYQQYEYVKPNGKVIVGHLEVNKNILQLVNEDEIVDIMETTVPLRNLKLNDVKGLTELQEEDVLIEGKEIYVNGKIYKLGLKNPTLEKSISKDKDGNHQVTLQAGNGRMVTLRGSVADAIVYQHLLNKLEQDATEQEIRELREQAERDSKIEGKYEKLISKTKNRDSRIQEIDYENYQNQKDLAESDRALRDKISDKKTDLQFEIYKEEYNLVNELAALNGEISRLDTMNRIQSELEDLRDQSAQEPSEQIAQKILFLEGEFEKLNKPAKTEFNPDGTPSEQLDWIVNNIPQLEFTSLEDASELKPPSQEDVDEYLDLLNTNNRNSVQKKRLGELRDKLLPYNLAEALNLEGVNIIDVINLYNQSRKIQDITKTQKPYLTEEDVQKSNKKVQDRKEFRSPNVGLVYDGAYIETQNKTQKVFHVKLLTFLTKALEKGESPRIVLLNENGRSNETPVAIIDVTPENVEQLASEFDQATNIKVDLNEQGLFLKKPKGETSFSVYGEGLLELIDAQGFYIKGQSTGYIAIYEQKIDGTLGPKESEFSVRRDGIEIPFDKSVLNSLKPGDTVTLEFDKNDDYNKTLTTREYPKKANIYVKKNGKLVQILKASDVEGKTDKDGWGKLDSLRKTVVKSKKPVPIKITESYMGLPLIVLNSDGTMRDIPIDESKVLAYGYLDENGQLQGDVADLEIDNQQYVDALEADGRVRPVMAFETNGKTVVFPINLRPQGLDLSGDVDAIMNDDSKSREQKMFEINSILEQHEMYTSDLALDSSNFDVNRVKTALQNVYDQIDLKDPEQFQKADKYTYINLEDPFMSSKLVLDLDSPREDFIESNFGIQEIFKQTISTKDLKGLRKAEDNLC